MSKLERYIQGESAAVMVVGSRLVLFLAVFSNVAKAAWAFQDLSSDEAWLWSTLPLAIALEGALAISSYALSEKSERGGDTKAPKFYTLIFAVMSAAANVTYFTSNVPTGDHVNMGLAWLFGIAAPVIALANGALSGSVTGQKMAEQDRVEDREFELKRMEAEAELERQKRLATNAKSRLVRTAVENVSTGKESSGEVSGNGNGNGGKEIGNWREFLDAYPNMLDMTGKEIGEIAGVTARTGNNWKKYAVEAGYGD